MTEFDYIIVGAGSSGCVLASRLSDEPSTRVLLIEGGSSNAHPFISMPRGFMKLFGRPQFYRYFPVKAQLGRAPETWYYGKGLGGSSAVNGTWYLGGMPSDYDSWVQMGNPGWGWADMLACFRALESYELPGADPTRGTSGPLEITQSANRSPVLAAVLEAGHQIGLPLLDDINTPCTDGIGYTQSTVNRSGRRGSSYTTFVKPLRSRANLTVLTGTEARRVLFEGTTAVGVECERDGVGVTYRARREVILSAGVFQSPKLLQLSGVGPADLLRRLDIPIVKNLPAVGRNFCDHAMFTMNFRLHGDPGLNREFSTWRLYRHVAQYYLGLRGLMASAGPPVTALVSSDGDKAWPDIQLGIIPFTMNSTKARKADPGRGLIEDKPGIMFTGFHLRPRSRGAVAIVSADFRQAPEVDANWWSESSDRDIALKRVRIIRELARAPALASFVGEETLPGGAYATDEAIEHELAWMLSPGLHGTGTCSMGPSEAASVVDARLRVHGLRNLRVVDCSIMPAPVSGNTNGPAMAIGVRAAELVAQEMPGRRQDTRPDHCP
jgi:choline dehydrogenase